MDQSFPRPGRGLMELLHRNAVDGIIWPDCRSQDHDGEVPGREARCPHRRRESVMDRCKAIATSSARELKFALTRWQNRCHGVAIMNGLGGPMSRATVTAWRTVSMDEHYIGPTAVTTCCSGSWAFPGRPRAREQGMPLLQVSVVRRLAYDGDILTKEDHMNLLAFLVSQRLNASCLEPYEDSETR